MVFSCLFLAKWDNSYDLMAKIVNLKKNYGVAISVEWDPKFIKSLRKFFDPLSAYFGLCYPIPLFQGTTS